MEQISELHVYSRSHSPQLNGAGKATGWVHLLDPASEQIVLHQTALRLDREGKSVWAGPIFQSNETSQASDGSQSGQDQNQLTAMGWFQLLNMRELHTGQEFQTMLEAPNGQTWQEANGAYVTPAVDEATTLTYSATENPEITDAVIIFDLLNRANIDSPTGITPGNVYGSPVQRNLTLQQFQNIGQQITQLVNVESGCDFYIDPITKRMDLYGPGASSSPSIPNGMGSDLGTGVKFTYPGNCVGASRSRDGLQTANRDEVVGQYGVGRADSIESQIANGLFEATDSLSDVVDENILIAYANVEVAVRQYPWTIISFQPRGLVDSDRETPSIPRPYDDYNLGDIVYCRVDRGSFQVGTNNAPQATRMFGWTVSLDDQNSVEKITSIQTTYQGLS